MLRIQSKLIEIFIFAVLYCTASVITPIYAEEVSGPEKPIDENEYVVRELSGSYGLTCWYVDHNDNLTVSATANGSFTPDGTLVSYNLTSISVSNPARASVSSYYTTQSGNSVYVYFTLSDGPNVMLSAHEGHFYLY